MDTHLDEIADGIYRISSYLPDVAPPHGFTFNQFLVMADEPLLFHTGMRSTSPAVIAAVARVLPLQRLRWISFGHVEADECGAMNVLLDAAPEARVAFGELGCQLSIDDLADRPPRRLASGEILDLGGRRIVQLPTPHAPHNWEAQVLFEETTRTLLCGDLFAQIGRGPAVTNGDLVDPALDTEAMFLSAPPGPAVPTALRRLSAYEPRTLAVMHGSSFEGDGRAALTDLADGWEVRFGGGQPQVGDQTHKETQG
jgi:flavorubredoxin